MKERDPLGGALSLHVDVPSRLQISLCPLAQWMFCDVPDGKSTEIRKYPADRFRPVRVSGSIVTFLCADFHVSGMAVC